MVAWCDNAASDLRVQWGSFGVIFQILNLFFRNDRCTRVDFLLKIHMQTKVFIVFVVLEHSFGVFQLFWWPRSATMLHPIHLSSGEGFGVTFQILNLCFRNDRCTRVDFVLKIHIQTKLLSHTYFSPASHQVIPLFRCRIWLCCVVAAGVFVGRFVAAGVFLV